MTLSLHKRVPLAIWCLQRLC